jgi:hypothetical protein
MFRARIVQSPIKVMEFFSRSNRNHCLDLQFVHSDIRHSSIHLYVYPFIHPYIHSSIHRLILSFTQGPIISPCLGSLPPTAAGEHLPPAAQRGVVCHRPPILGSNFFFFPHPPRGRLSYSPKGSVSFNYGGESYSPHGSPSPHEGDHSTPPEGVVQKHLPIKASGSEDHHTPHRGSPSPPGEIIILPTGEDYPHRGRSSYSHPGGSFPTEGV